MKPRRAAALALIATVSAVLLAACATPHDSSATPRRAADTVAATPVARTAGPVSPTTRNTYRPFAADGTIAVDVRATVTGTCWTSSIASAGTPSAYRCRSAAQILDPCFAAAPAAHSVVCANDPWSPATVLTLTGALPTDPAGPPSTRPWAIELQGGVRCLAATGTVPEIAGVELDYICNDGSDASLATPQGASVTARVGRNGQATLTAARVTATWRG